MAYMVPPKKWATGEYSCVTLSIRWFSIFGNGFSLFLVILRVAFSIVEGLEEGLIAVRFFYPFLKDVRKIQLVRISLTIFFFLGNLALSKIGIPTLSPCLRDLGGGASLEGWKARS